MELQEGLNKINSYLKRVEQEALQQAKIRENLILEKEREIAELHGDRIITIIKLAQYCMEKDVDISNFLIPLDGKIGLSTLSSEYLRCDEIVDSIGINGRGRNYHFRVFLDGERISFIGIKEREYPNEGKMARFKDYETFIQDLEKFNDGFSKFADLFEDYIENL